jgi:hypothetical protein
MEDIIIHAAELYCFALSQKYENGVFYHDGLSWHSADSVDEVVLNEIRWQGRICDGQVVALVGNPFILRIRDDF